MIKTILIFILCSAVIYFTIAAVLILIPQSGTSEKTDLTFDELFFDYDSLPELEKFTARNGSLLEYRYYACDSDNIIILLHGSGWHSRYFLPLAEYISSEGLAQVYTPDLRGHGISPERRGDVDYICQLEDDLADLISIVRKKNPEAFLILGGHSSGGGLAIRFAGSRYGKMADAFLLLSPFLKYNAPTMIKSSGGWANPYTTRIAGLTMLNNLGIHIFDHLPAIEFNMPEKARDGTQTLVYSHRLNTAYAPRNYKKDLSAVQAPLLVVAGTADKAFHAARFEPVMSKYADLQVKLLPDVTHMGIVVGPEIRPVVKGWVQALEKK